MRPWPDRPVVVRVWLLLLLLLSSTVWAQAARAPQRAGHPASVAALAWTDAIPYLAVRHLALRSIAPDLAQADGLTARVESGLPFDFVLSGQGALHLLAPAEQFVDSHSVLRLQAENGHRVWRLRLQWSSAVNPPLQRIQEGRVDGVLVSVEGVDAYGRVDANLSSLRYRIAHGSKLDPASTAISLSAGAVHADASDWFRLNPGRTLLSLKPERLPALIDLLRANDQLQLSFSLSDARMASTVGFFHRLTLAPTTLHLALVDGAGLPIRTRAGMRVVVRHMAGGFAALAAVNGLGRAQFHGLAPGQYVVEEVRLDKQPPLTAALSWRSQDLTVNASITVPAGWAAASSAGAAPGN